MHISRSDFDNKGEFYYEIDGKKLSIMTFSRAGNDKIIIDHTEVDETL